MIEDDIIVANGPVSLSGTLCRPAKTGVFPAFLWLPGSGPIDRDESRPGQALGNSKTVAHALVKAGIASLRFDKRGVGKSSGHYLRAGHSDFVFDGVSCLEQLKKHPQIDGQRVFLIGHSEGAMIAPQIAEQEQVAGIILLCPFLENPGALLQRQAAGVKEMAKKEKGLKGSLLRLVFKVFDPVKQQAKALAKVRSSSKAVGRLGLTRHPFRWLREFTALEPQAIFQLSECPALIIAGSKDFQCLPEDAAGIERIYPGDCELHVIVNMSHLLRVENNEPSVFNYRRQLKTDIMQEPIRLIERWLLKKINEG